MMLSAEVQASDNSYGENEKETKYAFFEITNFKSRRFKVNLKLRRVNEKHDIYVV